MPKAIEFVDTTAEIVSHHIQVRVDQNGPVKRDGRRGRIILEDPAAPPEVVRWLKSPQCRRADQSTGKNVLVWIDDKLLPIFSTDAPNADAEDEEPPPNLPAPSLPAMSKEAVEMVRSYQQRIDAMTKGMEEQLDAVRARYKEEVAEARAASRLEIAECDRQIAEARTRLATERKREADELDQMAARRRASAEETSAMADDLRKTTAVYREIQEQFKPDMKPADLVQSIADAGIKLQEVGVPISDMVTSAAAWLMSKAGAKIPD
jgi:hypothetical protein